MADTSTTAAGSTSSGGSPGQEALRKLREAGPELRNRHDALALLLHAFAKQMGLRLVGFTEEDTLPESADVVVPQGWNSQRDAYSFRYKHHQSALTFMLKALTLGDKLLVHGVALEDKKVQSYEIDLDEFVSRTADLSNLSALFKNVETLFTNFRLKIINPLLPGVGKEGYEAGSATVDRQRPTTTTTPPQPGPSPSGIPPRPFFGGEPGPTFHPYPGGVPMPGAPSGIGPFGPLHPGGPGYPDPDGFGNLVGPRHPGFGPQAFPQPGRFPDDPDSFGLPQPLPPGAVPPGARFDPFGPPRGPNFGGGRGFGGGGFGGGGFGPFG